MTLGTSIFLIAVGAIIRYAVTFHVSGVSRPTIGLILIIAGIVGVVLSLFYMLAWNPRRGQVVRDRVIERDPYEEPPVRRACSPADPLRSAAAGQPVATAVIYCPSAH